MGRPDTALLLPKPAAGMGFLCTWVGAAELSPTAPLEAQKALSSPPHYVLEGSKPVAGAGCSFLEWDTLF